MTFLRAFLVLLTVARLLPADEPQSKPPAVAQPASEAKPAATAPTPLNQQGTVLIDAAGGRLILKTEVVLRAGLLEMLLCRRHTKEHESILAINSEAYVIHAGLLALGAKVGTPVRYEPEFQAPTGQQIDVILRWKDEQGREHTAPAQTWVRHATYRFYSAPLAKLPEGFVLPKGSDLRYDADNKELVWFGQMTSAQRDDLLSLSQDAQYRKGIESFYKQSQSRQLEANWVFAGSGFYVRSDGTREYQAEAGNVICVANFGDALLDLSVASTASNEGLQFEPWTERIPPLGTKVEVSLVPVKAPADSKAGAAPDADRPQN